MQYGYALFPTQEMARVAQQELNNLRVHGRDIRVCEFNLQATLESSKDGKVMVSFKSLQRMDSIITEQTIRDVFERRYENPLSVVSIRKHTFKANGIQSGFGFFSFGRDDLDTEAVATVKKMEINGISFDCEWSNSGGYKGGQDHNVREEAPVLTAPPLKLEPASRADQQKSPRAIAMNEQHGNSASQDSLSPTVTDSATPLMTTTTGESPSWSDSASPSTRSPRAAIQRRANPAMSTAANGSSTPGRQVPAKRLGGSSIRSRTAGVSEKLREENANPFGSDDNPFPSFGTSTTISSDPPAAPTLTTNPASQPTASGWSGATTTYHAMQHPAMSISVPTSTIPQAFPGSPSYFYAVTSPSLTFNPYLASPGFALSAPPPPMGGNIPPTLMHHGAPSPQQSYAHSPRFAAHSVPGMSHHYHQMPNHPHQVQPSHIQHSVQMHHANPTYFNPSNTASGTIGPSTNASDFHPTMLQQTRGQRSSSSEDNHVITSATSTNNPGTPATAVASYYMSPGEAYAMVDRVTMSPGTMDAYTSFRPTPPTAYSNPGGMPMHGSGPSHATYHSQPPPAPILMTHQAMYSQQPPAHHVVPGMSHQYSTNPAHPGNGHGNNSANHNPNNGFSY
eukprot:gene11444-8142_t